MQRASIEKMDVNKSRPISASRKMDAKKVVNFVGDVKLELKKVEWTNKDELKAYTKIVLMSTFLSALFVYFADLIIQGFLGGVNLLVKFFTG